MRNTLILAAALAAGAVHADTLIVTSQGDAPGVCPDPDACTLRAAVAAASPGDTIVFAPALVPGTITLSGAELTIDKTIAITGPGAALLEISASGNHRVLHVTAGSVGVADVALADGLVRGADGADAAADTGALGGAGIPAEGGCVRLASNATLLLERVALRNCQVRGGSGGNGGSGLTTGTSAARVGGAGGVGGTARGGAIASYGTLSLSQTSIVDARAESGAGGRGGRGGGAFLGAGGVGGAGGAGGSAEGGSLFVTLSTAVVMRNATIASSTLVGGNGGQGGDGGAPGSGGGGGMGNAGRGGDAGPLWGGDVFTTNGPSGSVVDFEFTTLGPPTLTPGQAGAPGAGANGVPGGATVARGEVLFTGKSPRVRHSVIAGTDPTNDCQGAAVLASGDNLDSDSSCAGFNRHAPFAQVLDPPQTSLGLVYFAPRRDSPAFDAASDCLDLDGVAVTVDQQGGPRPRDDDGDGTARCDLGAIESGSAIFRNGFED